MRPYRDVRARGPWVYLERVKPELHEGMRKTKGGLYLPAGNMQERMGLEKGRVLSVGRGIWNEKKHRYDPSGVGVGDLVLYRGFLGEMNHPSYFIDDVCFVHISDILGFPDLEIEIAAA